MSSGSRRGPRVAAGPAKARAAAEALEFGPAVDRWLGLLLAVAVVGTVAGLLFDPSMGGPGWWFGLVVVLLAVALVLLLTVPLRYRLEAGELRVRAGLIRLRWPLSDVVRLELGTGVIASPTAGWTLQRVMLVAADGRSMELGPVDRERFAEELLRRAPHLQPASPQGRRRVWRDPARDRWGRGA